MDKIHTKRSEDVWSESERLVRSTLDSLSAHVAILDEKGTILLVNDAWRQFAAENSLGRKLACEGAQYLETCDQAEGEDAPSAKAFAAGIRRVITGQDKEFCLEYPCHSPTEKRWFLGRVTCFEGGRQRRVVVAHENITQGKLAQLALQESEERYRSLVEATPDVIMSFDRQHRHLFVSPSITRLTGLHPQEFLGKTHAELGFPEEQCRFWEAQIQSVFKTGKPFETEFDYFGASGHIIFNWRLIPIVSGNQITSVLSIARDITEQRRVEKEYQVLFREMLDGFALHQIICDEKGRPVDYRFLAVNPAFERQTGMEAEKLLGRTAREVFPALEPYWIDTYGKVALSGQPASFEHYSASHSRHFQVTSFRPAPGQFACIFADITERKNAEIQLRKLSQAVEQSPVSIIITDHEGTIEYVNAKFTSLTGYTLTESAGKNPKILKSGKQPPEFYEKLWKDLKLGKEWHGEFHNRKKNGDLFWESARISPIKNEEGKITHFLGLKEDVTERKLLEAQLRQAQKMEAVGQLAGGVAHDFNNILAAMLMNLGLLETDPQVVPHVKEVLKELEKGAKSAANLTRQLLLFSRRQVMQMKAVDLNRLLANLNKMLYRIIGEQITLVYTSDEPPLWIQADVGMIEQVVMNLCVNARDAMLQGGLLTIDTRKAIISEEITRNHRDVLPGPFICLSVSDTGCGMDASTLQHLFEPFFTTKELGKGTGLGLATVYGIVKQHHGWIEVESKAGKGSTFKVYFPAAAKEENTSETPSDESIPRGSETILLVEDETITRKVAALCLRSMGYAVLEAANGVDALKVWTTHKDRIQLLISDMIMPEGMTGLDLAERLRQEKRSLKVIISSGYSTELCVHDGRTTEGIYYLAKPYEAETLAKMLRTCLEEPGEGRHEKGA